jgi:hypothetical protein
MPFAIKDLPADASYEQLLKAREQLDGEEAAIRAEPPPQDNAGAYRLEVQGTELNRLLREAVRDRQFDAKQKVLRSQQRERARLGSRRQQVRDDRAAARAEHEQAGTRLLEPFNRAEAEIDEAEAALSAEAERAAQAAVQAGAPKRTAWPSPFRRGGPAQ